MFRDSIVIGVVIGAAVVGLLWSVWSAHTRLAELEERLDGHTSIPHVAPPGYLGRGRQ